MARCFAWGLALQDESSDQGGNPFCEFKDLGNNKDREKRFQKKYSGTRGTVQ